MKGWIERKELVKGVRFYVIVDIGPDPETADRRRRSHGAFKTKKEAAAELVRVLGRMGDGTYREPSKLTFGEYLDQWHEGKDLKPATMYSYRTNIERHIKPALGGMLLSQINPLLLKSLYADLRLQGRSDGKGGLSQKSVHYIHTIIFGALSAAVREGLIPQNPAERITKPKKGIRPDMKWWSAEDVQAFLAGVREDRLSACYFLALTTGMRRGELLGLSWDALDLDSGRLTIKQTLGTVGYKLDFGAPKTERSRRTLSLDPSSVAALRAHKARQNEERLALGPDWSESGLVFTQEDGSPVHPQGLSDAFKRHIKGLGVRPIRFHDLRHTYTTLALESGMKPWDVSDRLGHSSVAFTLDNYRHAIEKTQTDASNAAASFILGDAAGEAQ